MKMKYIGRICEDNVINSSDCIVIYGTGNVGKKVFFNLKSRYLDDKVVAFCDGKKSGFSLLEKPVLSVEEACNKYGNATFLISSCFVERMCSELICRGIKDIHIVRE